MTKLGVAAVAAMLTLAGCGAIPPSNVSSTYLKTEGGGFVLIRDLREVRYYVTLLAVKPLPDGSVVDAQFENPAGGAPLETTQPTVNQTRLVLRSPPVTGLKAHTRYKVQVKLYADAGRRQVLDSYTQEIQSLVNQASLGW